MGLEFNYQASSLAKGLGKFSEKAGALLLMYSSTKASEYSAKMKSNRKWTDRTGAAKATLRASVVRPNANVIRIILSHGVDYGIWLELANEQNYSIIIPTIKEEKDNYVQGLQNIFDRLIL